MSDATVIEVGQRRRKVSMSQRARILERDHFRCRHCGASSAEARLHVDHIVPFSKGGACVDDNLQTLCEACNIGKGNREQTTRAEIRRAAQPSSALIGCEVLRPDHETTCDKCDRPHYWFWRGRIVKPIGRTRVLVQWYEWGWGNPTYATVVSIDDIRAERWRVYPDAQDFVIACRKVLKQHDHLNAFPDVFDDKGWGAA